MEVRIVGCMDNTMDNTFESANRVYDKEGLCPTIPTGAGGGHTPKVIDYAKTTRGRDVVSTIRASYYKNGERNIEENVVSGKGYEGVVEGLNTEDDGTCRTIKSQYYKSSAANFCRGNTFDATVVVESRCVRLVGRNPEHPTDRTAGLPTEQRLEPVEQDGIVNTLTSVQKDNLILEHSRQYRIRKLTERECWRLMDFPDSDFDKAAEVESRTQLYKQAGNAIVRAVLMALFLQMNIQGIKNWNDRTDSEKRGPRLTTQDLIETFIEKEDK